MSLFAVYKEIESSDGKAPLVSLKSWLLFASGACALA